MEYLMLTYNILMLILYPKFYENMALLTFSKKLMIKIVTYFLGTCIFCHRDHVICWLRVGCGVCRAYRLIPPIPKHDS